MLLREVRQLFLPLLMFRGVGLMAKTKGITPQLRCKNVVVDVVTAKQPCVPRLLMLVSPDVLLLR